MPASKDFERGMKHTSAKPINRISAERSVSLVISSPLVRSPGPNRLAYRDEATSSKGLRAEPLLLKRSLLHPQSGASLHLLEVRKNLLPYFRLRPMSGLPIRICQTSRSHFVHFPPRRRARFQSMNRLC